MKRISSAWTVGIKYVLPALGLLILMGYGGLLLTDPQLRREPVFIAWMSLLLVVFPLIFFLFTWNLADVVEDHGSFLLVRRRGVEARVPLAEVLNVAMDRTNRMRRLALRLRTAGVFGDEVQFIPLSNRALKVFARNAVAEDLMLRVDAARRGAA